VLDAVGTEISGALFVFTAADTTVVSVSPTGVVQSLGPAAKTTISITSGTLSRTLDVTVTAVPTEVRVSPSSVQIGPHGKGQFTVTILDAIGVAIPNAATTWTTSDQNIVTITSSGFMTVVGPLGSATIAARSGTATTTVPVAVADMRRPSGAFASFTPFQYAWGLGVSSAGAIIAPGQDGQHSVRVDASDGTITPITGNAGGFELCFTADGATAYIGNTSFNRVDVVDVASNTVTGSFPLNQQPFGMQLSRDDKTLYVGSGNVVAVYDLGTKAQLTWIEANGNVVALARHPTADLLYASQNGGGAAVEIDISRNALTGRQFSAPSPFVSQSLIAADAGTIFVLVQNPALITGDIAPYDLSSGAPKPVLPDAGGFGGAITPDGKELWTVGYSGIHIIDLVTGNVRVLASPIEGRRIVFSADGSTAVISGDGGGIGFVR
jgi:hypothetical protein